MVSVHVSQKTGFFIHCSVASKNGQFSALFTAVYGMRTVDTRRPIWREITGLSMLVSSPWLVMGDFNSLLLSNDRENCNAVADGETKDFVNCLDTTGLAELKSCGSYYS